MAQVSAGQDGIQKLLAAEKEAQEIVAKARKGVSIDSSASNMLQEACLYACSEFLACMSRQTISDQTIHLVTHDAAKSERLKQAKAEAEKDIKAYTEDRENKYTQKESAVCPPSLNSVIICIVPSFSTALTYVHEHPPASART